MSDIKEIQVPGFDNIINSLGPGHRLYGKMLCRREGWRLRRYGDDRTETEVTTAGERKRCSAPDEPTSGACVAFTYRSGTR
ncbi:hypothetical protein EVAR_18835_1 [Eumeta japonica]|uniref:Uncharacterized protein n=1 Tax=Eumeta variegata TaxID=151549 RepID=A0A4C1UM13_EUMVA|nr:hypothetical protein EVAR_18835_1 [Eumeta japonica]